MNQALMDFQNHLAHYADILPDREAGEILKTFKIITNKKNFIFDIFETANTTRGCLCDEDVHVLKEEKDSIEIAEANFTSGVTGMLEDCRHGKAQIDNVVQFNAQWTDFLLQQYPTGKHQPIREKLDFIQSAKQRRIEYIGRSAPDAMMSFNAAEDTFVLYYHESASKRDPDEWAVTLGKFFSLADAAAQESDGSKAFIIVDCELNGQMGPEGSKGNEVVHYRNGQPMYDEFEEDDGEEGVPMAKPTIAPVKSPQAQKRGAVELPCPGSNRPGRCPPEMVHSWKCAECHDLLEYGFDDHFYCKCGKAPAESFTFHCGQRKHGLQYLGFQPSVLSNLVDKLKAFKEINILILGETGVGKSTWINGFVNFVTYATLDEALQEPVYLIPAHFTTLDEKYEMQKVTMGKSDNEDETPGQSCTQMPKTYVFRKGNNIIRLIDTPGIGDTRGAEQDKKNFQFIMDHLSHYDSLHGICILLKPNNARLTVMFRFCIKELLSHLHRDACENIVFVFTNARSTFYRPGDTYQALQKLIESSKGVNYHVNITLGPNTVYCVDNEAVRFMAALKFGIKFGESEQENFKKSWETSVKETNRLVDYVANRSPHMLRQTLSLNEARRQILAFTEPLAHITKNIQTNIQAADDKADEILHLQHSRKDLEGRLYVPSIDLETIPLPYPRTVCVAQKCIKMVGQKANYITHCHEHCYLTGIEPGKYPQPGLQSCAAMGNKQTCSHCGCIWEMHMHIEYEINEVEVPMVDSSIQALLSQRDGNILAVQQTIQDLQDRKAQLNNEMDEITKVATKFGYFLKSNAMIPYNDSMEDYLQYLIRAEEEKVAIGASRKGLEDYQGMLQRYREEKKLLEQAMASGANHAQITATEIDSAIKSLYSLPINGQVIKNLVETKNWTSGQQMEHAETIYKPAPQYKKQKKQSNKKGLLERGVDYVANLWTGGDRNRNQYGKSDYGGNYANGNHGYRGYQQAYPPKGHNYNSQYGHSNRGAYGYGADRYAPQNTYRPGSHSQTDPYAGRGP